MPNQIIEVTYSVAVTIERAAKDARMYRYAAKDCRRMGMLSQARRMERNARIAERAIVQAANDIIHGV